MNQHHCKLTGEINDKSPKEAAVMVSDLRGFFMNQHHCKLASFSKNIYWIQLFRVFFTLYNSNVH